MDEQLIVILCRRVTPTITCVRLFETNAFQTNPRSHVQSVSLNLLCLVTTVVCFFASCLFCLVFAFWICGFSFIALLSLCFLFFFFFIFHEGRDMVILLFYPLFLYFILVLFKKVDIVGGVSWFLKRLIWIVTFRFQFSWRNAISCRGTRRLVRWFVARTLRKMRKSRCDTLHFCKVAWNFATHAFLLTLFSNRLESLIIESSFIHIALEKRRKRGKNVFIELDEILTA